MLVAGTGWNPGRSVVKWVQKKKRQEISQMGQEGSQKTKKTQTIHGGDIYRNPIRHDFSVNINPLPLPPVLMERAKKSVLKIDRYPQYENEMLRERIAQMEQMPVGQVLCGNGASELFAAIVHAFRPACVAVPAPSFFGYTWAAQMVEAKIRTLLLTEETGFALRTPIDPHLLDGVELLFLASPANPVGNRIAPEVLEELLVCCEKKQITVVLDECFIEFTGDAGYCAWIKRFPNLVIVRAFTKIYRIPGIRLGYVLARTDICRRIARQLPEWNVSTVAQQIGLDLLDDSLPGWNRLQYLQDTVQLIRQERQYVSGQFAKLLGSAGMVFPSEANFLLLKTDIPLYDRLLEKQILIRDCANYAGLGEGFYRIAVKTHAENEALIGAVRCVIA